MASTNVITLVSDALTATATSDAKSLEQRFDRFIGWIDVSAIHAATTVAAKIQHSPDGTNWKDWITFTNAVGAVAREAVFPTTDVFGRVRSVVTLSGATQSATVKVQLWYDPSK